MNHLETFPAEQFADSMHRAQYLRRIAGAEAAGHGGLLWMLEEEDRPEHTPEDLELAMQLWSEYDDKYQDYATAREEDELFATQLERDIEAQHAFDTTLKELVSTVGSYRLADISTLGSYGRINLKDSPAGPADRTSEELRTVACLTIGNTTNMGECGPYTWSDGSPKGEMIVLENGDDMPLFFQKDVTTSVPAESFRALDRFIAELEAGVLSPEEALAAGAMFKQNILHNFALPVEADIADAAKMTGRLYNVLHRMHALDRTLE